MASKDLWAAIHAERQALVADMTGLADAKWSTPSLCRGWSVHDVLGHLVATAKMTPPRFFAHFAGAGFNFDRMTGRDVRSETAGGPARTLAAFRSHVDDTTGPPGPVTAMLGEAVIHGEDIRRPLGIRRDYPAASVVRCLDFFKGSNLLIGAKRRIAGLSLEATDTEWSTGNGPTVRGPAHSLLMAMTGRSDVAADLSGDGLGLLRSRS